ncbi:MAG: TerB family tellurite resistance protein [Gemmatimonadota bacterium]|nr:TerB family tellurite resistance protein [Gemmatimonadota bacterium]
MLDTIKRFFERHLAAPPSTDEPAADAPPVRNQLALAACALLLELAHADDEFSQAEQRHIEETLTRHFNLDEDTVAELIRLADQERRSSVDLYQFTSLMTASYDEGQRMVLAEMMWGLVYADGTVAKHESHLMRKLSQLLDLRPGYLAEAKQRALKTRID